MLNMKLKFLQNFCLWVKAGRVRWEEASQRGISPHVPHTTPVEIAYMHMCVLIVCKCISVYMQVYVCRGQKLVFSIFSYWYTSYFLRYQSWSSLIGPECLVNDLHGASCLCLASTRIIDMHITPCFYMCSGDQTQVLLNAQQAFCRLRYLPAPVKIVINRFQ